MKNISKFASRVSLLLLAIVVCLSATTYAQTNNKIKGIVVDESGLPLIGATVVETNTNNGTVTDVEGKFVLKTKSVKVPIKVSFLGYVPHKMVATGDESVTITLALDNTELEEVVVIGYGAVKKSDLSGSVSVLDMDERASELPYVSVDQLMQGRMAGVDITSVNGAPGTDMSITIRGVSTISGDSQPLYVIDGFISDDNLSSINPNDIESLQVLKDASATAIYGSRATNGVIIITTKTGTKGRAVVTYNGSLAVSSVASTYDMLNAYDYCLYQNELDRTSGGYNADGSLNASTKSLSYSDEQLEMYKTVSTDWQDLMFNTAISQNHQVSVNGGTKDVLYNFSAGYTNQNGLITDTSLERYSFRANINATLSPKFKLAAKLNYTHQIGNFTSSASVDDGSDQVLAKTLLTQPTQLPYEIDYDDIDIDADDITISNTNAYVMIKEAQDRTIRNNMSGNLALDYKISKKFTWRNAGSVSRVDSENMYYKSSVLATSYNGYAEESFSNRFNINLESTLNYNQSFKGGHKISGVAGYTYEDRSQRNLYVEAYNFPSDDLGYDGIEYAQTIADLTNSVTQTKLSSFLARANYTYKDRYIVTATGRYDGSSLLAKGNQWAFFPSAAFAWRINREQFLKDVRWISNIKLRLSYGITGNQSITYASPYTTMTYNDMYHDGESTLALENSSLGNSDLGWEKTRTYNVGIDVGVFNNRLRFTADFYDRNTTDMLMNYNIAPSTGYSTIPVNIGDITNKGAEFELSGDILTNTAVKWSLGGNIYFNRNVVNDLNGLTVYGKSMSMKTKLSQSVNITQVGYAIGSFYGYVTDGVYQNAEEVANGPVDSVCASTPGSIKYVDISGPDGLPDGEINDYDKTIIGTAEPKFSYGLNTDVSYKNFTLSMVFKGRAGGKIANMNRFFIDSFNTQYNYNITQAAWDGRWTGEGTSNFYPVVDGGDAATNLFNRRFSTFLLEDASYFRLSSMTLAYQYNIKKKMAISSVRIYCSGTNIFTITEYTGYDPEVGVTQSVTSPGIDFASYPTTRTFSLGVKLTF